MTFHPDTAVALLLTASLDFAAAWLLLRDFRATREPYLASWIGAAICFGLAMAGYALRGVLPDFLVVLGANSATLLGFALVWQGIRRLRGADLSRRVVAAAPLPWLLACLVPAMHDSFALRTAVMLVLCAVLIGCAARDAWLTYRQAGLRGALDLTLLFGASIVWLAWRFAGLAFDPALTPRPVVAFVTGMIAALLPILALGVARERAALREAERRAEALRAGRAEVERLLPALPAIIFHGVADAAGGYRQCFIGGDLQAVTGWPAARVRAQEAWAALAGENSMTLAEFLRRLRQDGRVESTYRMRQPDGSWRWLRSVAIPLEQRPNGDLELVGYTLDITAERAAEARAMATARLSSLGEMAAGIAHELKQPLAIVSLAAENGLAALDRQNAQGARQRFLRIQGQAERAATVIEHLRRFARGPEEGLPGRPVGLAAAVRGPLALTDASLREAGIVVSLDLGTPPPTVLGDLVAIEQVVLNLLANARDALATRPPGLPRQVTISAAEEPATGLVRLRVADTGGGIPDDILPRIFEPFVTTKGPESGTGLGLSICHGLVRAMGGLLEARNEGSGAVFIVTLPAAPARAALAVAAAPAGAHQG